MIYFNGLTTDVKKKAQLGPTVVYCALVNLEDIIDVVKGDVINVIGDVIQKDLQTHLLIYHPLHVSVYSYFKKRCQKKSKKPISQDP